MRHRTFYPKPATAHYAQCLRVEFYGNKHGRYAQLVVPGSYQDLTAFDSDYQPDEAGDGAPLRALADQLRALADELDQEASRIDAEEDGE